MARSRSFPVNRLRVYATDGIYNWVDYVYEQRNRQVGRHGTVVDLPPGTNVVSSSSTTQTIYQDWRIFGADEYTTSPYNNQQYMYFN